MLKDDQGGPSLEETRSLLTRVALVAHAYGATAGRLQTMLTRVTDAYSVQASGLVNARLNLLPEGRAFVGAQAALSLGAGEDVIAFVQQNVNALLRADGSLTPLPSGDESRFGAGSLGSREDRQSRATTSTFAPSPLAARERVGAASFTTCLVVFGSVSRRDRSSSLASPAMMRSSCS